MKRFEFKYSLAYLLAVMLLQGCVLAIHVEDDSADVDEEIPFFETAIDSGVAA